MYMRSQRQGFLTMCAFVAAPIAAIGVIFFAIRAPAAGGGGATPEQRLRALKLELPKVSQPSNPFVRAVKVGNTLYVSGHGPLRREGTPTRGKVGKDLSLAQGKAAARMVGLNVLASVRDTLGSLDKVVRVVKVLGMVNCTTDFTQQPAVVNGFSELMVEVFGEERGKGARSAVGMGSLPGNIAVEIEAIFEVRD